jgi:hypothetical protein
MTDKKLLEAVVANSWNKKNEEYSELRESLVETIKLYLADRTRREEQQGELLGPSRRMPVVSELATVHFFQDLEDHVKLSEEGSFEISEVALYREKLPLTKDFCDEVLIEIYKDIGLSNNFYKKDFGSVFHSRDIQLDADADPDAKDNFNKVLKELQGGPVESRVDVGRSSEASISEGDPTIFSRQSSESNFSESKFEEVDLVGGTGPSTEELNAVNERIDAWLDDTSKHNDTIKSDLATFFVHGDKAADSLDIRDKMADRLELELGMIGNLALLDKIYEKFEFDYKEIRNNPIASPLASRTFFIKYADGAGNGGGIFKFGDDAHKSNMHGLVSACKETSLSGKSRGGRLSIFGSKIKNTGEQTEKLDDILQKIDSSKNPGVFIFTNDNNSKQIKLYK